jgi:methylated-DNA-[protein]-cysteine S-methyltransferase
MTTVLGSGTTRTPIGVVRFALTAGGAIAALEFDELWDARVRRLGKRFGPVTFAPNAAAACVAAAIDAYFAGDPRALNTLEVDAGGTTFQARVWAALRAIPAGSTLSYASIARAIGAPRAVRAVGSANAVNPVAIVVPCHRVIGDDGQLRGYAGGVERKEWLLAHERRFGRAVIPDGRAVMSSATHRA